MILLSYTLSEQIPAYGNGARPIVTKVRDIEQGDTSNQFRFELSSHHGTHVDCPYHFDRAGKKVTDYSAEFWDCGKSILLVMERKPNPGEKIGKVLMNSSRCICSEDVSEENAEIILLKTGWCYERDSEDYMIRAPAIDIDVAGYIRNRFPSARFFGLDLISISSYTDRPLGRESHQKFLKHEKPILLIEDMDLRNIQRSPGRVLVSPIFLAGSDASPCTVWANL